MYVFEGQDFEYKIRFQLKVIVFLKNVIQCFIHFGTIYHGNCEVKKCAEFKSGLRIYLKFTVFQEIVICAFLPLRKLNTII